MKLDVVGMTVMAFAFTLVMCFADDGTPSIPALVWYMLTISTNYDSSFIRDNLFVLLMHATGVFGSIGVYLYRNKVKIRLGKQFIGFLAMFIAMALGGILYDPSLTVKSFTSVFTIYFCMIIGYLYFLNVIKKSNSKYFARIMTYTGLLLVLQTASFYLNGEYDFFTMVNYKLLEVGWGNSNSIGALLILIAPFTLYLVAKVKIPILYILIFALEMLALVLTLSRGSMLMAVLGIPVLMVYTSIKAESKKTVLTSFVYLVVFAFVILLLNWDLVAIIFEKINTLDSSGRTGIYALAVEDFLKSPIFGTSMYGRVAVDETNMFMVYWYHSTPFQFIANAGAVGLGAYILHLVFKYKMLFAKGDVINKFILFGVLMWSGYALIDVLYFSQNQIVFLVLSLVFAEKNVYNKNNIRQKNTKIKKIR